MRLSIPRPVRRWRWEWLAVLLSILFYGSCSLSLYGCSRELFTPGVPLEESIERFDNAIPELEKILQSYGAAYHESKPIGTFLYARGLEGEISDSSITASLTRGEHGEGYTLRIWTGPALTPEQSMPDEQIVKSLCEWQSALLEDKAEVSLKKKVPTMLADAHVYWSSPQANQKVSENIDKDVANFSVYEDHAILTGGVFWGDDAYFSIQQFDDETYYSQLAIYCRRSR